MERPGSPAFRPRAARPRLSLAAPALLAAHLAAASPLLAQGSWVIQGHPTTRDLNKLSFVDGSRGWVVGDGGTILATTNGGDSWATQTSPVGFDIVDIDMVNERFGWALAQQYPSDTSSAFGTTVLRTTNGGAGWTAPATFNEELLHAVAFTDSVNGVIGGDQGKLYWTSDGGARWERATVELPQFAQWPVRDIAFRTPTFGLATGGFYDVTGLVWRTTDGGRYWTYQHVASEPLFAAHFFDPLDFLCVGGDLDYGAGMVRTTDGGLNWTYTYLGIWGQAMAVSFRTPIEGWAPLGFAGTFMVTTDAGSTWGALFTPDSTAMNDVVFTDPWTGYMVGAAGTVLEYVPPATAVGERAAGGADGGLLLGNSPNPFHPRTRIGFVLPRRESVSLKVFDVAGREVATLVDEALGPGVHSRVFDGGDLPSGVYYYRVAAGRLVETRKMVLIQ